MYYCDLNQKEAESVLKKEGITALLPIGAVEVHGNHLPLDTDCRLAKGVAEKVSHKLGDERCVILPCVPYGQVWSLGNVPGTINIPDDILTEYLFEIAKGLCRAGVKRLAVINAHVGNGNAIKNVARKAYGSLDMKIYYFTYPGASEVIEQVCETDRCHGVFFHADEIETSYMLYLAPDKVDMEKAVCRKVSFPKDYEYTPARWDEFMDTAVLGDATKASAEKGKKIIDAVVENICEILKGEE